MQNDLELDMILAAYDDAASRPEGTRLRDWVKRYPQHADELVRYAVHSCVFEHGASYFQEDPAQESLFMARANAVAERMRREQVPAIPSLVAVAKERGLSVPDLARRLNVSPLEVTKLNQRLIRAATLPKKLVRDLAAALGRTFDEVAAYLRQRPTLAPGVSYKAGAAPRVGEAQDFADAVADSRGMTEAQKAAWRAEREDLLGDAEE
jgi:transcriptional regulator with XRE-family HTH domain